MLKTVKFLLISSAGIAFIAHAQNATPTPAAPPVFSDETKVDTATLDPAAGVAQLLGIDKNAAAERLELQQKAVDWANELIANPPTAFVDMELQQTPNFKINLYFSKDVTPGEIISSAPNDIRRFVQVKRVKNSKAERQQEIDSIVSAINAIGVDFGVFQQLSSDKIILELADMGDKQRVIALIPPKLRSDIKVRKGYKLKKAGGIYAGNWYKKGASGSALCTMAWAVRNSRGQEGVMTAGHCQPRNPYFPYVDGGTSLGSPYSYRDIVANGKTYDFAIYNLGTHYSGPYVYVDNNVSYNGKTNSVAGFGDGYYSVAGVRKYYSQLNGLMVCKNGARTGFTCGQIETNSYSGNGYYRLVKVSNSSQPFIAVAGDSGAPAFAYPNGSQVNATGIVVAANEVSGNACDNTQNAGQCAFFYMPLSYAAEQEPYTVNTTAGFVTP